MADRADEGRTPFTVIDLDIPEDAAYVEGERLAYAGRVEWRISAEPGACEFPDCDSLTYAYGILPDYSHGSVGHVCTHHRSASEYVAVVIRASLIAWYPNVYRWTPA
jgi:hypothetical protein